MADTTSEAGRYSSKSYEDFQHGNQVVRDKRMAQGFACSKSKYGLHTVLKGESLVRLRKVPLER